MRNVRFRFARGMGQGGPRPARLVQLAGPRVGQQPRIQSEKLWGVWPGVAAKLVHLAGCRFHMQNRTVFDCLLDRSFDDLGVGGTDGVHTASSRLPVAAQNILKPRA